jgi:glycosyltransferase involved in cell wall biosynthesis
LLQPGKISVLGDGSLAGVDILRFDRGRFDQITRFHLREKLGISPHTAILIFIGRITRDKGIRELLSAARKLHSQSVNFKLLLLGPMDDEAGGMGSISRSEFEKLSFVRYLGYSTVPEEYMAIADVLCLPSYREGFGTVVIEAAAMGIPTVGTRITGLVDAVEDGVTGVLVPVRDAGALADALQRLIADPGFRMQLGNQARLRARSYFSSERVNASLLSEYGKLLDKECR